MNKAEWDKLKGWEKNCLVSSRVFEVQSGCLDEMGTPILYWINKEGHQAILPCFTTDRNACALVLDEIEKRGLLYDQFSQAVADELGLHRDDDELIAGLRLSPDTICFCALEAVENG